jgi:hypothetical protein
LEKSGVLVKNASPMIADLGGKIEGKCSATQTPPAHVSTPFFVEFASANEAPHFGQKFRRNF